MLPSSELPELKRNFHKSNKCQYLYRQCPSHIQVRISVLERICTTKEVSSSFTRLAFMIELEGRLSL